MVAGQERAAGAGNVGGHGLTLRLEAKAASCLAVGADAQVADEPRRGRNHPASLVGCVSLYQTTTV